MLVIGLCGPVVIAAVHGPKSLAAGPKTNPTGSVCKTSARTSPEGSECIPIEVYRNYILLPVRINGSVPLVFILDSGAKDTQISARVGRQMHVESDHVSMSIGRIQVENVAIKTPSFDDLDSAMGRHIDGIVGFDLLRKFIVKISYMRQIAVIQDPGMPEAAGDARMKKIPLRIIDGFPFADCLLKLNRRSVRASLEIGTGSGGTIDLDRDFADSHHLLADPSVPEWAWGGSGAYQEKIQRIDAVRVGSYTLPQPLVYVTPSRNHSPGGVGLLGAQVLGRFDVTFNYAQHWLGLTPASDLDAPFDWDMTGIFLDALYPDYSRYVVSDVLEGSPAAEAGVRSGDVLLSINGETASALHLDGIERRFRIGELPVEVEIERGGQHFKLKFRMKRLI